MSDLTDNLFYLSAERIWLCIRLNNASLSGPVVELQMISILAKKKIWGTENPHAYIEMPTHPQRVTV